MRQAIRLSQVLEQYFVHSFSIEKSPMLKEF